MIPKESSLTNRQYVKRVPLMTESIRILIVEDLPTDAELAIREIRKSIPDCVFQRVETEDSFLAALENYNPDLILADYNLPRFTGLSALKLVLERSPQTPLVIYTGSKNEDIAVDCMKAGAANYIIKENIKRLGTAIIHALEEKQGHIERKQAEEALRKSEIRYRTLFENASDGILYLTPTLKIITVNEAFARMHGYSIAEIERMNLQDLDAPETSRLAAERLTRLMTGGTLQFEAEHYHRNGHIFPIDVSASLVSVGGEVIIQAFTRDITERKRHEREMEAVVQVSAALRLAILRDEMMRVIVDQISHLLNAHSVAIGLRVPNEDASLITCANGNWAQTAGMRIPLEHTRSGRVMRIGKSRVTTDQEYDPRLYLHLPIHDLHCAACVPLIAQGEVIGWLSVETLTALHSDDTHILEAIAGIAANALHRAALFERIQKDASDLALAYDSTLEGWVQALELRDHETEGHTRRVVQMTVDLAISLGIGEAELVNVRRGALLHDIGKMGIPDSVLLKPDALNESEWAIMRRHPEYAQKLLGPIEYLHLVLDIPAYHHEKWDGSGYPRGLKGAEIPLLARIFAVVDVWDALRSDRPYRPAWSEEKALAYISDQSGQHFDPQVVQAFLKLIVIPSSKI